MPLPASVQRIKVHPAIGVARVSTGDDFFVYGDNPATYKSGGLMRRQAVRYRLFAYGANNDGIEELTPDRLNQLGLSVVWHARVGNRKIAVVRDPSYTIVAEARSDQNGGQLIGQLNGFVEGGNIPLGEIRPDGHFIPPKARIFKETATTQNNGGLHRRDICDNAGDGFIWATITDQATGQPVSAPVRSAYVLIAPQDFNPERDDPDIYPLRPHLYDYFLQQTGRQNVNPGDPVNATARDLDREALERCTTDFLPGIEFSPDHAASAINLFYSAADLDDPNELRVAPRSVPGQGAEPGELTAGLCSPWQNDFIACTCTYWAAQRPDFTFPDDTSTTQVHWLRKEAANHNPGAPQLTSANDIINHVDKLGVLRDHGNRVVETERTDDLP